MSSAANEDDYFYFLNVQMFKNFLPLDNAIKN